MKLIARDLAVGYDPDAPLQKHIDFTLQNGEILCVLGPNGCGKTTLVKTLLGVLPPIDGSLTVDGSDITAWSAKRLSQSIAYIAQNHDRPFPYEVRDVIMMGRVGRLPQGGKPSEKDYNLVENAMEELGIRHLRNKPYVDISGGELQMVMFARALVQEPQIIVMDEPTAALDYGNAVKVIEKVRDLADEGFGIVMITHNPDHAFMTGANVALFKRQKPMEFGPASEVITRENIQEAYGINVKLVEFAHDNQEIMRMCAPEFRGRKSAGN